MAQQGNLLKKTRRRKKVARKSVSVRPTHDELAALHARAKSFGFKSLSKYLIERGLREGGMIVSADRERVERLLFELRKVGRNVNQIARRVSGPGRGAPHADIERAMREVERLAGQVGEALKG